MTSGEQAYLGLVVLAMLFFGLNLAAVARFTKRDK